MDGIKIEKWKKCFTEEARNIETEFMYFFKDKRLNEYYVLKLDQSDELTLKINNELPREIKERLEKLLITTKPEDSV